MPALFQSVFIGIDVPFFTSVQLETLLMQLTTDNERLTGKLVAQVFPNE